MDQIHEYKPWRALARKPAVWRHPPGEEHVRPRSQPKEIIIISDNEQSESEDDEAFTGGEATSQGKQARQQPIQMVEKASVEEALSRSRVAAVPQPETLAQGISNIMIK
ncbi:hypothetical protein MMC24_006556 [Lignoscripta atroalba]|nr:hypothetical protein [Lignoscripta atroalba]